MNKLLILLLLLPLYSIAQPTTGTSTLHFTIGLKGIEVDPSNPSTKFWIQRLRPVAPLGQSMTQLNKSHWNKNSLNFSMEISLSEKDRSDTLAFDVIYHVRTDRYFIEKKLRIILSKIPQQYSYHFKIEKPIWNNGAFYKDHSVLFFNLTALEEQLDTPPQDTSYWKGYQAVRQGNQLTVIRHHWIWNSTEQVVAYKDTLEQFYYDFRDPNAGHDFYNYFKIVLDSNHSTTDMARGFVVEKQDKGQEPARAIARYIYPQPLKTNPYAGTHKAEYIFYDDQTFTVETWNSHLVDLMVPPHTFGVGVWKRQGSTLHLESPQKWQQILGKMHYQYQRSPNTEYIEPMSSTFEIRGRALVIQYKKSKRRLVRRPIKGARRFYSTPVEGWRISVGACAPPLQK